MMCMRTGSVTDKMTSIGIMNSELNFSQVILEDFVAMVGRVKEKKKSTSN